MVIEYSLPRISIISSYINTNKTLIIFLFCKLWSSYFPPQIKRPWLERLRLILQLFLIL